jgi:hypothetical protein
MVDNDHLRKTLEFYRGVRQQKIDSIKSLLAEVNSYEVMIKKLAEDLDEPANIPPLDLQPVEPANTADMSRRAGPIVGVRPAIRRDEFFGLSQRDAAKAYLKMVGYAISLDELVSMLQAGGAKVGGADPKRTLYVSLYNKKEFVWPSKDHIGLAEFYGNRK